MAELARRLTREEQARLEIGRTEIGFGVKWALVAVGLFTLFAVPTVQTHLETRRSSGEPDANRWPRSCQIAHAAAAVVAAYRQHSGGRIEKLFGANEVLLQAFEMYEKNLKADSFLGQSVLPWAQELLAHAGSGNEKAYLGRRQWLFYRPGIDYCIGPGFLQRPHMARRGDPVKPWQAAAQPDPRPAILQFHRALAQRNIRLVLMPIPDKATLHPEKFSPRYEDRQIAVHNPSYRQFLDDLETQGVLLCDVTDVLARHRNLCNRPVYLATDTHWRPEAVELAAAELARLIEEKILLAEAPRAPPQLAGPTDITNLGDIARMLQLRQGQDVFKEEIVTIRPVLGPSGAPWRPDRNAEILLLGDSFANIYSLESLRWGAGAGLAEQLSFDLGRPVDAILRNDDGAYATREMLRRELAEGSDRLAGKKVVVWQFAARELAVGDWRFLDTPLKQLPALTERATVAEAELVVSGTIAAKSAAPRAGAIPYPDHVFTLDLADLRVHQGTLSESMVAVYLFSMKNHRNTDAFSWPIGKRVTLRLQPWKPRFFARYGRINRTESEAVTLKPRWWGEVVE